MAIRAELIQHDNVPVDGNIEEGAFIPVDGHTVRSEPDGGCGDPHCNCNRGHFFHRLFPRDDAGTVFGYTVMFDTRDELESTSENEIARLAQNAMH